MNAEDKLWIKHGGDLTKVIRTWSDYVDLAQRFYNIQPIYYDKTKTWWLWNKDEYKWVMVDDTDIMNAIDNALEDRRKTTESKMKGEILEALRRVGRLNAPEPMKPTWVQFKNKIYDIATGENFESTPKYFAANPLPWNVGTSMETPTIDRLLCEWAYKPDYQDETWANTLLEIIAYSMLSCQPLQRLFALTGAGANGKGTYLKLIKKFIGKENIAVTELRLLTSRSFESSALYKKLIVFMSEVQEQDMKSTNLIKAIAGEDPVRYEFKGKTSFQEDSYATCIVATNSLPTTPDRSVGFYRKWLIIDFPNVFEITPNLIDTIPEVEFENLALKCITKARDLLESGKFTNEGTMEERAARYESRSNPVGHFITEFYEEDSDGQTIFKDFFDELQPWLVKNNHRKLTTKATSALLKELGWTIKTKDIKSYTGVTDNYGEDKHEWKTKTLIFGIRRKNELKIQ